MRSWTQQPQHLAISAHARRTTWDDPTAAITTYRVLNDAGTVEMKVNDGAGVAWYLYT